MTPEINYESVFDVPAYKRMSSAEKVKTQFIEELHKISGKSFDQLNSQEKKLVEDAKKFAELLEERSRRIHLYKKQSLELRGALSRYSEDKNEIQSQTLNASDKVKSELTPNALPATRKFFTRNKKKNSQAIPVEDKGTDFVEVRKEKIPSPAIPVEDKGTDFVEVRKEKIPSPVSSGVKLQGKTTQESQGKVQPNLGRKNADRYEVIQNLSATSIESLHQILRSENLFELANKLQGLAPKDGKFTFFSGVSNYKEFGQALKDAGYKVDGIALDDKEVVAVYQTILDYLRTQNTIKTLNEREKIKILFDDGDGMLKSSNGEASLLFHTLDALHLDSGDGFGVLLENIGMDKQQVFSGMEKNLFSTRENIHRALKSYESMGYNLPELVKKGKFSQLSQQILQEQKRDEQIIKNAVHAFMTEKGLVNLPSTITEKEKQEFGEKLGKSLQLQALSASYIDGTVGVGTSIDTQEFTRGVLDSLSLGVNEDGKIGVSVNKALFAKNLAPYGTSVMVGVGNTLSPYLGISQQLKSGEISTPEELFQMTTDRKFGASLNTSFSSGMKLATLNFEKIDHETSHGIEQQAQKMHQYLSQNVGENILKGIMDYPSANSREKEVYLQMKQGFDKATFSMSQEQKQQYMELFLQGYTNAYRNELYQKAQGTKLTNIGIGVLSIAGFYNLPIITLGGEKISTSQQEILRNTNRQQEVTNRKMSLENLGGKKETIDGQGVVSFPIEFDHFAVEGGKGILQVSAENDSQVQIKQENGRIYVGGVDASEISIIETTYGGKYYRTLVVGEGLKDENGLYLDTQKRVDTLNAGFSQGKLDFLTGIENNENIQNISQGLTQIISSDALPHKNTPGLTALQKDFFEFRRGNSQKNLDQIWESYLKVLSHPKFLDYALQDNKMDGINFKVFLYENKQIHTYPEKIYILQALAMALTSKGKLLLEKSGQYSVEGGEKTIHAYNSEHKRDQYFDAMMKKEIPSLSGNITQARNKWNERFGNLKQYSKFTRKRGMALSGTEVGTTQKINGLTPLSDGYDLIGDEKTGLIPMELNNTQKGDLINKIPNYVLEGYLTQLNEAGFQFKNIQEVRDFIKNGGNEVAQVEIDVFFGKNAQCINDAIVFDISVSSGDMISVGAQSSAFIQKNKTLQLGVVAGGKLKKKGDKDVFKEEEPEEDPEDPETEPDQEVDPEPNPGEPIGPDPVEPPVKPEPKPEPKPDPKPVTPSSRPNQEVRPAPNNVVEVPITQPDSPVVNVPSSTPTTSSTNSGRGR